MTRKRIRGGSAVLLALLVAFSLVAVQRLQVLAAEAIDTDRSCSIDFSIAGEYDELKNVAGGVAINLYKVATVNSSGAYTVEPEFAGLDVSFLENNESAADIWLTRAQDAAGMISDNAEMQTVTTDAEGKVSVTGIETGLYLIAADRVETDLYAYEFTPYLVSLPGNYYYESGDDSWIYDMTGENALSLKPGQTPLLGSLQINKTLINQNVTTGSRASFVFQVDIVTPKGETSQNTLTLTFEQIGTKDSVIEDIPAGSQVTVEEVYSGAGYRLTAASSAIQTVIIPANEQASVSFENEHDGTVDGGYGIVNNFRLDENNLYVWTQLDDNASRAQ